MGKTYTIKELAKITKMPESTVRYYRDRHADFFPYEGSGRKKRYEEQAIKVLRLIAEKAKNNESAEDIEKALSLNFTRIIEAGDIKAVAATADSQRWLLDVIGNNLSVMADQKERIERLEAQGQEQAEALELLRIQIEEITNAPAKQNLFNKIFKLKK